MTSPKERIITIFLAAFAASFEIHLFEFIMGDSIEDFLMIPGYSILTYIIIVIYLLALYLTNKYLILTIWNRIKSK